MQGGSMIGFGACKLAASSSRRCTLMRRSRRSVFVGTVKNSLRQRICGSAKHVGWHVIAAGIASSAIGLLTKNVVNHWPRSKVIILSI